jgi:hypothetical protein
MNAPRISLIRPTQHSPEPPEDIAVDDRLAMPAMQRKPRRGCVRADTRDRTKVGSIGRATAVEHPRECQESFATGVQADPIRQASDTTFSRSQHVPRSRITSAEQLVDRQHLRRSRSLKQQLSDERQPRILILSPGIRGEVTSAPAKHTGTHRGDPCIIDRRSILRCSPVPGSRHPRPATPRDACLRGTRAVSSSRPRCCESARASRPTPVRDAARPTT